MVRNIERTFRSNAKSNSSSVASSTVPWCTKPAQLNRMSIGPASAAAAAMAAASSTSSRAVRRPGPAISATFAALTSVAMHLGAGGGEGERRGAADALRGGGDEGALAVERGAHARGLWIESKKVDSPQRQ